MIRRSDIFWYSYGGMEIYWWFLGDMWLKVLAGWVGEGVGLMQVLRSILRICLLGTKGTSNWPNGVARGVVESEVLPATIVQ